MRKRVLLACVVALTAGWLFARQKNPTIYTIPLPPKPDFSSLQWLIGDWSGKTAVKKAPGDVHLSVAYALQQRFLKIKGDVSLPATKTAPATHESWVGMLSQGASSGAFTLRLFTSNGFMTRYQVTVTGSRVLFNPQGGPLPPQGWLFRWMFAQVGSDVCTETVDVAPPGKSFFNYYSATLSRVAAGNSASTAPRGESAPN
ncbi:MAG TPA: hypothetical protein VMX16_08985 [Terriglobia bacterium]|nr:hypothetical protein [Terriglobia bacterium]